jgi:hypothetical protein
MKDLTRRLSKIMILLSFMTTANCYAQFSGGLQGTVEDSTRAAVSNAKVTLLNQDAQVRTRRRATPQESTVLLAWRRGPMSCLRPRQGSERRRFPSRSRPLRHAMYPSN